MAGDVNQEFSDVIGRNRRNPPQNSYMRIAELSTRSGVPKTTIHYYLQAGLLHAPVKTGRTMAYYDASHLDRLKIIRRVKTETGVSALSLKEALGRTELKLPAPSDKPAPDPEGVAEDLKIQGRRKLIEAALQVFSQRGFRQASVKAIAKTAGVSTGAFYHYFPDKRGLFVELVKKIFSDLRRAADAETALEHDHVKKMVTRARLFFRFFENFGEILFQVGSVRADDPGLMAELDRGYSELLSPVVDQVVAESAKGTLRKMEPELLAYSLIGMVMSLSARKDYDRKFSEEQIIQFLMDFCLHGALAGPNKPRPPA